MKKSKKHNEVVTDFKRAKEKHLERLATEMLKNDQKNQKLKEKNINKDYLNLF
jgi:hypothetical protein